MQPQTNKNTGNAKSWLLSTLIFFVVVAGVFAIATTHQRAIADWVRLHNYQPSAAITSIVQEDAMTDKSKHIFYVNHPTIETRTAFSGSCPSGTQEKTIVLGCYKSDQAGIFLLDVTDARLTGVKQVTAAHEMLHAAYDRLTNSERTSVNKQLLDYYQHGLTDERIKTTIDAYKKSEPDDVVNEMHSIFGTEVANLPSSLEEYYKQYFTSRSVVTSYSARYQSEFTIRRNQLEQDDSRLKSLKADIDDKEAQLKDVQQTITQRQSDINDLRSSNITAYNAAVPGYNALIVAYNAQVAEVKDLIANYNALVAKRNATAIEEDQLVKSLSAESQTIHN